jgi:hypothetical protein
MDIVDHLNHGFQVQCAKCEGLGIIFDCTENAPSSTEISCRHCGASRGTLGSLRQLAQSARSDLFDGELQSLPRARATNNPAKT